MVTFLFALMNSSVCSRCQFHYNFYFLEACEDGVAFLRYQVLLKQLSCTVCEGMAVNSTSLT